MLGLLFVAPVARITNRPSPLMMTGEERNHAEQDFDVAALRQRALAPANTASHRTGLALIRRSPRYPARKTHHHFWTRRDFDMFHLPGSDDKPTIITFT
jgi:hypothetical protein